MSKNIIYDKHNECLRLVETSINYDIISTKLWFAWYPCPCEDIHKWVWLRRVYKIVVYLKEWDTYFTVYQYLSDVYVPSLVDDEELDD